MSQLIGIRNSLLKSFEKSSSCSGNWLLQSVRHLTFLFSSNSSGNNSSSSSCSSSCSSSISRQLSPSVLTAPSAIRCSDTQLTQVRHYKVKTRLRRRCRHCFFIWRNGRLYVECLEHPRHKQHHVDSLLKGYDNIAHGYNKNELGHL